MRNYTKYTLYLGLLLFISCSDEKQITPDKELSIPDDTLAFYLFESYNEYIDLRDITVDSIKAFGDRIIGYHDIVSYDTSEYIFELNGIGKENVDSLISARYARRYPTAVVSDGEILFGIYINHPALSSLPDWFYLDTYTLPPWPACQLYFCLPALGKKPEEPDLRINSRMLDALALDDKLK